MTQSTASATTGKHESYADYIYKQCNTSTPKQLDTIINGANSDLATFREALFMHSKLTVRTDMQIRPKSLNIAKIMNFQVIQDLQ